MISLEKHNRKTYDAKMAENEKKKGPCFVFKSIFVTLHFFQSKKKKQPLAALRFHLFTH